MHRFLKSIAILILTAYVPLAASAQASSSSKSAGRYVASAYQGISNSVIGGPYATATVSIQLAHAWTETPDGRTIYPYSTSLPVTIFNSSVTGTFGTGTGTSDTTHTASVSLGQPIQIQITSQASETLAGWSAPCSLIRNLFKPKNPRYRNAIFGSKIGAAYARI